MEAPNPLPALSRVVWVTLNVNQLIGDAPKLVTRSAEVCAPPWNHEEPWLVNVVVTLDGQNDTPAEFNRYGTPPLGRWLGSVPYDPKGEKVPSWRWPTRS